MPPLSHSLFRDMQLCCRRELAHAPLQGPRKVHERGSEAWEDTWQVSRDIWSLLSRGLQGSCRRIRLQTLAFACPTPNDFIKNSFVF